jgi:signal transduction histidine kinase
MSVTASSRVRPLLIPLLVFSGLINLVLMYVLPGAETIPFHLVWIGLSVVYGLVMWPLRAMLWVLGLVAVTTGYVLVHHAQAGVIGWEETTEVPLMTAVFVVMVWHVRRRQQANVEIARLAEAERRRAEARDRFVRLASHELRTPITVARGYAELMRSAAEDPAVIADSSIVLEELDRLAAITHRLVTLVQLEGADVRQVADVDAALIAIVERWKPTADRQWTVCSSIGRASFNPERLKAAVDSLVENAVKFTDLGDDISVEGDGTKDTWTVTVTDSGPGMSPECLSRLAALGNEEWGVTASGTGLGLATVGAVVRSWNGRLEFGTPPAGGTVVRMEFPRHAPVHDGRMTVLS